MIAFETDDLRRLAEETAADCLPEAADEAVLRLPDAADAAFLRLPDAVVFPVEAAGLFEPAVVFFFVVFDAAKLYTPLSRFRAEQSLPSGDLPAFVPFLPG